MRCTGILLAALTCLTLACHSTAAAAQRPNFVVFLVDDLGHQDISPNNPTTFYETPALARLAASGMRFTQGYAACPVCSPTRYSLMTGRYPARSGLTDWLVGKRQGRFAPAELAPQMELSEVTLAEMLHGAGYRTAFLGKWHLGPTPDVWPEHQGFEINLGGHHAGSPPGGYFSPYKNPRLENGPDGEHLPARLASEAARLIGEFGDDPFLVYLSFYSVHTPLQGRPDLVDKYRQKAAGVAAQPEFMDEEQVWPVDEPRRVRTVQNHPVYAAMVEAMDTAVGTVLDAVHERGLDDNTVVVFTSDNGGLSTSEGAPTSNLPLRGGKGWLYEGGLRTPWIIRAPGLTAPGAVSDVPICTVDLLPTVAALAGTALPADVPLDGVSLVPVLRGEPAHADRPLHWHYPHYGNQGGFPAGVLRVGNWKLIERYEDGRAHLYDLAADPGERHDVAEAHPDVVARLRAQQHVWYTAMHARFLQPKDGRTPWRPK